MLRIVSFYKTLLFAFIKYEILRLVLYFHTKYVEQNTYQKTDSYKK